ncbi:MAG: PqiC family protein [Myxococcota bacterium]
MRGRRAFARGGLCGLVLLALAGTGCPTIGGPTPPSRFYVLAPLEPAPETTDGPGLGMGPTRLAKYLDRPQMVTRRGANALELAEFDRWGEPLSEAVPRVVLSNLGALLGSDRLQLHPWRDPRGVDLELQLDVYRFDGPRGGPVELVARWQLRRGAAKVERIARIAEAYQGTGYEAQAAAMSRALARLCREIAAAAPR